MNYKVFIASAGLGTRLGEIGKNTNKALVTVGRKPSISHIIDKFDKDADIVVALGHMGGLVQQYLEHAYPERNIQCVNVDPYDGPGSGLGRTLLACKEHLQCPFIFTPNDTIVMEEGIPAPECNWLGHASVENQSQYRKLDLDHGIVRSILEKGQSWVKDTQAYIGLAGIRDYESFWSNLDRGVNKGAIEMGESFAFKRMINDGAIFIAEEFTWYDTGNLESLETARNALRVDDGMHILPKEHEDIWFVNDKVVKYSADDSFISQRCSRVSMDGPMSLDGFVPRLHKVTSNMYSYEMVRGNTLSRVVNEPLFSSFLKYAQDLWTGPDLSKAEEADFKDRCDSFYKTKTYARIEAFRQRFGQKDKIEFINGQEVPQLKKLLDRVDWTLLSSGLPSRYHGDLHFENVLVAEDSNFLLLDWRQDFAGILDHGDRYYDLAKIMHGLIVSHEIIDRELYSIDIDGDQVKFDFHRTNMLVELESRFRDFIVGEKYDLDKTMILTSLIFLNIAALHHYPYSHLLYYLGKSMLYKTLGNSRE